jgi:hypothetical protein
MEERPRIKHASNPWGENQILAVAEYLEKLIPVIKECPAVPDTAGRDSISVENILKIIDTLFEKYKHSVGSFDYDRFTGERVD